MGCGEKYGFCVEIYLCSVIREFRKSVKILSKLCHEYKPYSGFCFCVTPWVWVFKQPHQWAWFKLFAVFVQILNITTGLLMKMQEKDDNWIYWGRNEFSSSDCDESDKYRDVLVWCEFERWAVKRDWRHRQQQQQQHQCAGWDTDESGHNLSQLSCRLYYGKQAASVVK